MARHLSLLSLAAALTLAVCMPCAYARGGGPGGGGGGGGGGGMSSKVMLGKMLYFDANLSQPAGQSCATCHHPSAGFADPDKSYPVSKGAILGRFGNRNSPTSAYQATAPEPGFNAQGVFFGGQFWDGRAPNLLEQAKGPFLNPLEMNNPDPAAVVTKVSMSQYSGMLTQIYGSGVFSNTDYAYHCIADAIAEFEKSPHLNRFNSRYDQFLAGNTSALTVKEKRGLKLFEGKGRCMSCHPSRPSSDGAPPVFTDFTYDNVGLPRNPANPFYNLTEWNPLGWNWVDYGLAFTSGNPLDAGKMKVPTLRNIAKTAPYGHNGYFNTLTEIVSFYNTRDIPGKWPAPEVPQNVNTVELGNLGLTQTEVADLVAFLGSLTDTTGGSCGCGCCGM